MKDLTYKQIKILEFAFLALSLIFGISTLVLWGFAAFTKSWDNSYFPLGIVSLIPAIGAGFGFGFAESARQGKKQDIRDKAVSDANQARYEAIQEARETKSQMTQMLTGAGKLEQKLMEISPDAAGMFTTWWDQSADKASKELVTTDPTDEMVWDSETYQYISALEMHNRNRDRLLKAQRGERF